MSMCVQVGDSDNTQLSLLPVFFFSLCMGAMVQLSTCNLYLVQYSSFSLVLALGDLMMMITMMMSSKKVRKNKCLFCRWCVPGCLLSYLFSPLLSFFSFGQLWKKERERTIVIIKTSLAIQWNDSYNHVLHPCTFLSV